MSIIYKVHNKYPEEILVREFKGDVDVDQIIASWEYLLSCGKLTVKVRGVINDLSNCNLIMDLVSFKKLAGYLKRTEEFKSLKLAVVSNSPKNVVFPFIGETQIIELMIRPFSTETAAVNWIVG